MCNSSSIDVSLGKTIPPPGNNWLVGPITMFENTRRVDLVTYLPLEYVASIQGSSIPAPALGQACLHPSIFCLGKLIIFVTRRQVGRQGHSPLRLPAGQCLRLQHVRNPQSNSHRARPGQTNVPFVFEQKSRAVSLRIIIFQRFIDKSFYFQAWEDGKIYEALFPVEEVGKAVCFNQFNI